jgi:hypothetical protein
MNLRTLLHGALPALLVAACADGDEPLPTDTDPPVLPATADWMGEVFEGHEETALGRMLLPGAFNSSSWACHGDNGISPHAPSAVLVLWDTLNPDPEAEGLSRQRIVDWAKTQELTIAEQLVAGVRAIEINVTLKEEVLTTWHSVYGVPLAEELEALVAFAVAHPQEVVVLTFGFDFDSATWPALAEALTAPGSSGASLCDVLYDGDGSAALATLAEVRASGRNVIWGADGELRAFFEARGDCPMSELYFDRQWSYTTRPEGVEAKLAATVPGRDPAVFLQNDFYFSLDASADLGEQVGYLTQHASLADALELYGFSGDFPGRMIEAYDGEAEMNIFAGAMFERTDLVEAVIARNRGRLGE